MNLLASLLTSGSTTVTTVAGAAHKSSGSILDPIAKPIAWLLAGVYAVIPNYGVAIIALSIIWMLLIAPLTLKSTRSMLAMQRLQPELKKLQEKHKNDKQAFAQAQMDLFREHNVSPFGSCLPMLLPLPVFFALFRVIDGLSHMTNGVPTPKYLSPSTQMYKSIVADHGNLNAFGMNLAHSALSAHSGFAAALPYWILLVAMGVTSYFQSSMMMNRNPAAMQNNPQMRMMKYLPLLFVLFCVRFPAGVILYYTMSNICRIVQQDAMYRFDPKVKTLVAKDVAEVEELTHEIDERADGGGSGSGKGGRGGGSGSNGQGAGASAGRSGSGSGGTKKPNDSSGADANGGGGRSRFRALLAAAAEQQKDQKPKPTGTDSQSGSGGKASGAPAGGAVSGSSSGKGTPSKRSAASTSATEKKPSSTSDRNGSAGEGSPTDSSAKQSGSASKGSSSGSGSSNGKQPTTSGSSAPGGNTKGQPRPKGRTNRKRRGR